MFPSGVEDSELLKMSKEAFSYVTVIDAGSSGCRAHVYKYGKLGRQAGSRFRFIF